MKQIHTIHFIQYVGRGGTYHSATESSIADGNRHGQNSNAYKIYFYFVYFLFTYEVLLLRKEKTCQKTKQKTIKNKEKS